VIIRNIEITPGEKRAQGDVRTTVLLDTTSAVYSCDGIIQQSLIIRCPSTFTCTKFFGTKRT
jgi:hypothetical protein